MSVKKLNNITQKVKEMLAASGYDLEHADIKDTPKRMAKIMVEYSSKGTPPELRSFPSDYGSMVSIVDHRAYTKCPHHLETVEMDISIAYIPNGRLLGISKFARVADYFSKGLMVQEEIAELIADGLMAALNPLGVAVFIQGRHMCMRSRGVKSYNSDTVTSVVRGLFKDDVKAREEFFSTVSIVRQTRR